MYHNTMNFMRSVKKEIISSQRGYIDQAFWMVWKHMANGLTLEDALKQVNLAVLEPAAKSILMSQLKMALKNKPKPQMEDLPSAYKTNQKTAAISNEWARAVRDAKNYWAKCREENRPVGDLNKWLIENGYPQEISEDAASTVSQYYHASEKHDQLPISESESKKDAKLNKLAKEEYEFTCTMAYLPKDLAEKAFKIALEIPDSDLYDPKDDGHSYGRENEPHITVKFGTHTDDPDEIKKALNEIGKATATLAKISFFDTNDDYDVVKIDVISEDLAKANKAISDNCKCTDSYPDYKPHMTIAYVKKGSCKSMLDRKDLDGVGVIFDEFVFQDRVGNRTIIPLKNKDQKDSKKDIDKVEKMASIHPLDEMSTKKWLGMQLEAGNYHQQVKRELINVLEDVWKVSEKDFKRVDEILKIADKTCRSEKAEIVIQKSNEDNERPRLCAERIYCLLKTELGKTNESPN